MSRAQVILEAVRLTANGEFSALEDLLTTSRTLKLEHSLRILLTFLPKGTDPESYLGLLRSLSHTPHQFETPVHVSHQGREDFEAEARRKVRRLRLLPLAIYEYSCDSNLDPLSLFLIHQAYRIDADTGSLALVARLLEPFVEHSETLQTWMISTLLPLLRLEYEYYPTDRSLTPIRKFETMETRVAIQNLLSRALQRHSPEDRIEPGRDLRRLVGPWIYGETMRKRRRLNHGGTSLTSETLNNRPNDREPSQKVSKENCWSYVNDWILHLGLRDFSRAVDAVTQWDGPNDVDYGKWGEGLLPMANEDSSEITSRYTQAGLAITYVTNDASLETIMASHRVLLQAARLMKLSEPPDIKRWDAPFNSGIPEDYIGCLHQDHFHQNNLLESLNHLTQSSDYSLAFLNIVLASSYKLFNLGCVRSSKAVAELILFSIESDQMSELRRALYKLKSEKMDDSLWASVRRQILWLRDWEMAPNNSPSQPRGVFSRIPLASLENELLRAMVDAGCYSLPSKIYCQEKSPLPAETLEATILDVALSAYDAASNGNRTRGGVRKASDIISAFRSYFPSSRRFDHINALLSATHAMSFYSLTLQHGVPFQPVNIRVHKDPLSLIGRILAQNPRSYTHLDDLIEIGQNLVPAGLCQSSREPDHMEPGKDDQEHEGKISRRRVTRMAIEAALAENDFDTAYSYVVNRLSRLDDSRRESDQSPTFYDDISWRAAYAAGRYSTSNAGGSALRRLEQRMELLSQALILAPPSALSELVTVWEQCEKQMADLVACEAAEEKRLEEAADHIIPGGFAGDSSPPMQKPRDPARSAMLEEAPMGLFDVARGAAASLSKNAFPLRGGQKAPAGKASNGRPVSMSSTGDLSDDSTERSLGAGKVRKRDMVSNMVTGGLASGIGWVIG